MVILKPRPSNYRLLRHVRVKALQLQDDDMMLVMCQKCASFVCPPMQIQIMRDSGLERESIWNVGSLQKQARLL